VVSTDADGNQMIPEVVTFAQVSAIIVGLVGSLTWIGVLATRSIHRTTRQVLPPAEQVDERLERLQQSVDTLAVEVERIAEAQRFTAKLLAERTDATPLG
jgi:hypothetical protein